MESSPAPEVPEDWPRKADRKEVKNMTLWGVAQPLPFLLRGPASRFLAGVVEEIRPDGAVVRLLWRSSFSATADVSGFNLLQPGESENSPLLGFINQQALDNSFRKSGRPGVGEEKSEETPGDARSSPLSIGQPVCVEVRSGDSGVAGMLNLALTPDQPLPLGSSAARRVAAALQEIDEVEDTPSLATGGSMKPWRDFLVKNRLALKGSPAPTRLPPDSWEDPLWAEELALLPQSLQPGGSASSTEPQAGEDKSPGADQSSGEVHPLVPAGWAVTASNQDLVVAGPLTATERVLLFLLPLLRHLRSMPQQVRGSRPLALVLTRSASFRSQMARKLREVGFLVVLGPPKPNAVAAVPCDVLVADAKEVMEHIGKDKRLLSRLSFLVLDNLELIAAQESALKQVVAALPPFKWGQTLSWATSVKPKGIWRTQLSGPAKALTEGSATLRAANAVWDTQLLFEFTSKRDPFARVLYYAGNYPKQRIVIFADSPAKLSKLLEDKGLRDRLDAPDDARNKVLVVENDTPLESLENWDVLIQADPPPSREEYLRRLGSCRQLAIAYLSYDGPSRQEWAEFAEYAKDIAIDSRDRELLSLIATMAPGGSAAMIAPQVIKKPPRLKEISGRDTWDKGSFMDDFQVTTGGSVVWSAGVEEDDVGIIFEKGL